MTMQLVTLDFETYYDRQYSLSKMTTEEYINDPRFQIIGVSTKIGDAPAKWFSSPRMEDYVEHLASLNNEMMLCQNTAFDAAILSWRLGVKPKFLFDTLSMARAVIGHTKRHSLAALAEQYGIGAKGAEVHDAMGKRLEDFTPNELAAYGRYCCNDAELTYKLFKLMGKGYPKDELRLIDMTLRMYTQPGLVLNKETIQKEIDLEEERKNGLLRMLNQPPEDEGEVPQWLASRMTVGGITGDDLRSNDKFAEVLRRLGVEPPTKISAKTGKKTWAFAKSDADFKALMTHDDPVVIAAVDARLGHKSTQKATRAQRFMGIATRMRKLPVALGYYGAHTGRYGAWDKQNLQNLPAVRGSKDPNAGLLRKAIEAPPGYKIVVADQSQIEARMLVWQAGQADKVEAFAQGRDIYSEQASVIYSRKVNRKKNPDDAIPGHVGKCTVLGCGYGLGHPKFGGMIYVGMLGAKGILFTEEFADQMHADVSYYARRVGGNDELAERIEAVRPLNVDNSVWITHMACADHIINVYRADNQMVKNYWSLGSEAITAMYRGEEFEFGGPEGNLLRTEQGAIVLPNGLRLLYPEIEYKDREFTCLRKKEGRVQRVKLYGGAIVENVTQALARIVISDNMLNIDRHGYKVVLQVHDEVVLLVREEEAEEAYSNTIGWMRTAPAWATGLPLDAEGGIADRYGDAK